MTFFCFHSKETERTQVPRKIFVSTCDDSVDSSFTEVNLNNVSGRTHEEADTPVFLHAADCVKHGHTTTTKQKTKQKRTADSDVLVLAISVVEEIKVEELWVAFGTRKHFRYIAVHAIVSSLGTDNQNLPSTF